MKNNIKFIPIYIFEYNNNLEQSEKYNIIFTPINDYINQIKCHPKKFFQPILNEENQQIGKLLILIKRKQYSSRSFGKNKIIIINKYNNLDIYLKKPEQELAWKNKQNENINYELDFLRKERKLSNKKNEDKTVGVTELKSKIAHLEKIIDDLNHKSRQN